MDVNEKLSKIYEGLLKGLLTTQEASAMLTEMGIKTIVQHYINKECFNPLIPFFAEDLQNVALIIRILQFIYNNLNGDEPPVDDYDYNDLYEILVDNSGIDIISAPVLKDLETDYHLYPQLRGTLDKVYYLIPPEKSVNKSRKTLDDWKKSAEERIFKNSGKRVNLDEEDVWVFPKWDGLSAVFEMNDSSCADKVLQRGDTDTNEGTNVTRFFEDFKRKPEFKGKKYGLKTEVMMKEKYLKEYNEAYGTNYKNTRSIVASILNSKEPDDRIKLLTVVPLRVRTIDGIEEVAKEAFTEYPYIRCRLKDRGVIEEFAQKSRWVDGLRCDGAVIHIINPEIQKILGREDNKNKYEVAYKFTEEVGKTVVEDVIFTTGLFASINPVAKVKPIKLKGNTISEISLGSMGRFHELNLSKGDDVKILYDIIPYLTIDNECQRSSKKPIEAPSECPECHGQLTIVETEDGISYSCKNDNCPCRDKGRILNYLTKLDIDNISYGIVETLYNRGYLKSIIDLYKLKDRKKELYKLPGFGKLSVNKILSSIDARMKVFDYEFLGAIGIEDIGQKTFKKVLSELSIDELMDIASDMNYNALIGLPGIKEKTAKKIVNGLYDNFETIRKLMKILIVEESGGDDEEEIPPSFKVCFTKVRDPKMELEIKKLGGAVVDNVTKDTDLLVVPKLDIESNKVDKAKAYEIQIVTIEDLPHYLNIFKQ